MPYFLDQLDKFCLFFGLLIPFLLNAIVDTVRFMASVLLLIFTGSICSLFLFSSFYDSLWIVSWQYPISLPLSLCSQMSILSLLIAPGITTSFFNFIRSTLDLHYITSQKCEKLMILPFIFSHPLAITITYFTSVQIKKSHNTWLLLLFKQSIVFLNKLRK